MAEKKSIIDSNAMYNIGYGANKSANNDQELRSQLINTALVKVGGFLFNKISSNYRILSGLRDKADTAGGAMDDSLLSLENQESNLAISGRKNLVEWQGELDEALKQQSLSFSPKKRRAAKIKAANVYKKMNTLKGNLSLLNEKKKVAVGSSFKAIGEDHKMGDDFQGWNEGMTTQEFEMSAMLAGGQLTNYMGVDPETGNIFLTEQDERSKQTLLASGFSQEEADRMIADGGNLSPVITNLRDIKFAPPKDPSVAAYQIGGLENAMKHGANGGDWEGNYASIRKADIANFLDTAPANAVRSAYFSKTGFGADGLMSGNSPAHDYLISQGYSPERPEEWIAALEIEKAKTFEIGSAERDSLGVTLLAGEKKYYENSKKKHDEDNPVGDKRANVMVNGSFWNPKDYDAAYGPNSAFTAFITDDTVLEKTQAIEFPTPSGKEYQRRHDGYYELTKFDKDGKKVYDLKVTTDEIKRNEKIGGMTKSTFPFVGGDGDGGGDNVEAKIEVSNTKPSINGVDYPSKDITRSTAGASKGNLKRLTDMYTEKFGVSFIKSVTTKGAYITMTGPDGETQEVEMNRYGSGNNMESQDIIQQFVLKYVKQ
jgi:hypothetical protein